METTESVTRPIPKFNGVIQADDQPYHRKSSFWTVAQKELNDFYKLKENPSSIV